MMWYWCGHGGDDGDGGTVVMGTGSDGGVGDGCGLPRRWGWQDDGGAYDDGRGQIVMGVGDEDCGRGDDGGGWPEAAPNILERKERVWL
nr:hypothetical protein [Tanacetum cinerariifolium]